MTTKWKEQRSISLQLTVDLCACANVSISSYPLGGDIVLCLIAKYAGRFMYKRDTLSPQTAVDHICHNMLMLFNVINAI